MTIFFILSRAIFLNSFYMSAKQNEPGSALTHCIGALLAIAGLVLLIVIASLNGGSKAIVSYTIFGSTMIVLYSMSALFHFFCAKQVRLKRLFQRFDHIGIYLLIAGTYTPVSLVILPPGWGWSLFGVIWGLAIVGSVIEFFNGKWAQYASLTLYLVMGWLAIVCFNTLKASLTEEAFFWLIGGGIMYTIGAVFYILDSSVARTRWCGMHEIFHIFVLLGSFAHFIMLYRYVL